MNNIIVGMGEPLWDVLPEGKKIGGAYFLSWLKNERRRYERLFRKI